MLALMHHLLLHDQIPLAEIAALCRTLTTGTLILEWVPPTDVMFRELLRGRDALYAGITEPAFRRHFAEHFLTLAEHRLENGRILFHFERRQDG